MNLLDKVFKGRAQQREIDAQSAALRREAKANSQRIQTKTAEVGKAAEEALALIAAADRALVEKGLEETADLPRAPAARKDADEGK